MGVRNVRFCGFGGQGVVLASVILGEAIVKGQNTLDAGMPESFSVLMHELRGGPELTLAQALSRLSPCDLVLVEGFKHDAIPKIEVYRRELGKPALYPDDPHVIAVASDTPLATRLPQLDINDPAAVANFVLRVVNLDQAEAAAVT